MKSLPSSHVCALRSTGLFQAFAITVLLCFMAIPGHAASGAGDSSPRLLWSDGTWSPGEQSQGYMLARNFSSPVTSGDFWVSYLYSNPSDDGESESGYSEKLSK